MRRAVDVEGAEHAIVPKMLDWRLLQRVSVLALECHGANHGYSKRGCATLMSRISSEAPSVRLVREKRAFGAFNYSGLDSRSLPPPVNEIRRLARQCSQLDHSLFGLAWKRSSTS